MLKRLTIFFFLASAYSVLLAHNFTPHQHVTESSHTKHHDHHHGENHEHEEKGQQEEDDANAFQYFQHIGFSELQYHPSFLQSRITSKQLKTFSFLATPPLLIEEHYNSSLLLTHRPREESRFLSQSLAYFFRLKAPPAIMSA